MAEQNDPMQDVLFREVDDDLREEELKRWWDKYGLFVILFVALSLGAAAGFEGFKSWRKSVRATDSVKYELAIKDRALNKGGDAAKQFKELAENGRTGYTELARMQYASMAATGGKMEDGLEEMKKIIADTGVHPVLRDLARYKLAGYMIEQGKLDEAREQLAVISEPNSEWHYLAKEMQAALALEENDTDKARVILTELATELAQITLSQQDSVPENLNKRTMELLDTLGGPLEADKTKAEQEPETKVEETPAKAEK